MSIGGELNETLDDINKNVKEVADLAKKADSK